MMAIPRHYRIQVSMAMGIIAFYFLGRSLIGKSIDLLFATKPNPWYIIALDVILMCSFLLFAGYWGRQLRNVHKVGRQVIYQLNPNPNSLCYGVIISVNQDMVYIRCVDGRTDEVSAKQIKRRAEKDEWEAAKILNV